MDQRWALYIDIEGFSAKWNDTTMEAFRGINALMQGIFRIGDRFYRDPPERLFAHQFGDGFLVASDFHERLLDRAVLVSVALMRHLLACGATAKCAIDEGVIADIQNCYPREIRDHFEDSSISLGSGVMTISPVLGSALINTVRLTEKCPPGPMLCMAWPNTARISCGITITQAHTDSDLAILDWLRGEPHGLADLQIAAGFRQHTEKERVDQLLSYVASNALSGSKWEAGAQEFLLPSSV